MLWALSGVLDNIATAMLGGAIVMARYGSVIRHCRAHKDPRKRKLPRWLFMLLVAVIAVSNLGGAASAIGDTTTTMMWIDGVAILVLAMGYPASLLGQLVLAKLAIGKHKEFPEDYDHTHAGRQEYIDWTWRAFSRATLDALALVFLPWRWGRLFAAIVAGHKLYPMLGIPGMVAGNIIFEQPGLGLWVGMLGGYLFGRLVDWLKQSAPAEFGWTSMLKAVPNTVFLLLLVYSAKLIPLEVIAETIFGVFTYFAVPVDYDIVAVVLGLISPIFDNIPLASLALDIGGFHWALLALAIGFGGSMLWFGSSAGVALAKEFPELEQTRDWFPRPFLVIFAVYWVILLTHLIIWRWLPLLF
jgi:Na+/H+ antiporter NhaD/arsenite permease-like protein